MEGLKKDVKTLNAIEHPLLRKWVCFSLKEKKMSKIEGRKTKEMSLVTTSLSSAMLVIAI